MKDSIEYTGTAVAFIQLVAAMDRDGEITRTVRGKRTYRIGGSDVTADPRAPVPAPGAAVTAAPIEIDYDRLARAMVREFFLQAGDQTALPRLNALRD